MIYVHFETAMYKGKIMKVAGWSSDGEEITLFDGSRRYQIDKSEFKPIFGGYVLDLENQTVAKAQTEDAILNGG